MSKKRDKARRAQNNTQTEAADRTETILHVRFVESRVIPEGTVAADLSQQAKNNSYDPPHFYVDQPFRCVDCGKEEVWTASRQKWYYEVAKGSIYGRAVRCRACRQKHRREIERRKSKG